MTVTWMETQRHPYPDMSINHKRRDFDAILRWRDKRAVNMDKWRAVEEPEIAKQVPVEEGYWELFGKEDQIIT